MEELGDTRHGVTEMSIGSSEGGIALVLLLGITGHVLSTPVGYQNLDICHDR